MIPSLTGSLTNTKLGSLYGDAGQEGLFILWFNIMSELMFPRLTGIKLESLYIWGCRLRWPVYISVKCYVGISLTRTKFMM